LSQKGGINMAKPGEIVYDFDQLDRDEKFQEFLDLSLENNVDIVDIEKCKEGIDWFVENFTGR
jgi:hypothetical protein